MYVVIMVPSVTDQPSPITEGPEERPALQRADGRTIRMCILHEPSGHRASVVHP